MTCQKCNSSRVASIVAKHSDRSNTTIGDAEKEGYSPKDMGIGGGDYVRMDWCLDCGQIQGEWPRPITELEAENDEI